MASVSPPKPWERPGAAASAGMAAANPVTSSSTPPAQSQTNSAVATSSSSLQAPSLPSRPNTLSSVVSQTASNYAPYGASRLGTSPYGGYGYNSYSSPYSRLGGMYGGGYGSMYGGYGGMYGGMQNGMQGGDPNSLTNSFSQSTQATFQMIESIVGAFGGFAQMLESTYMATHSSFFAMVSVAEQFGNLRTTLGSVLGIFTILRWIRTLFAKLTGRPLPADATSLTPSAFSAFLNKQGSPASLPDGSHAPPRPSKKPFFFFVAAVFGLPYLMGKLIRALARSQEAEAQRQQEMMTASGQQAGPIDPSRLDFCRVLYDYTPDAQAATGIDLTVRKGDIVAVLSRVDPLGNSSEWWKCRARDGTVGYLPGPYLQTIQRKQPQQSITAGDAVSASGNRTDASDGVLDGQRTKSLMSDTPIKGDNGQSNARGTLDKPEIKSKMGDISPESFQKSAFYS